MATEDARAELPGHAEDVRDAAAAPAAATADDAGKQDQHCAPPTVFSLGSLMAKVSFRFNVSASVAVEKRKELN